MYNSHVKNLTDWVSTRQCKERRATFTTEQKWAKKHYNQKKLLFFVSFYLFLLENTERVFFFSSVSSEGFFFSPSCDDSFSIPGASAARGGKTTTRLHYTKLSLFKLSTSVFVEEVIERKKRICLGPSCSFLKIFRH